MKAYPAETTESFCDGHVSAFAFLGGVPQSILYDNTTLAVARILGAPDAVGKMIAGGLHIPFYLEYELRARHPRGVMARLRPYTRYYWSTGPDKDQPPFPVTLFVVDREDVEATYVSTAARMSPMSLPILVSCSPVLSRTGILGRSWHLLFSSPLRCFPLSCLISPPSWPIGDRVELGPSTGYFCR